MTPLRRTFPYTASLFRMAFRIGVVTELPGRAAQTPEGIWGRRSRSDPLHYRHSRAHKVCGHRIMALMAGQIETRSGEASGRQDLW
jgi:hypothetical protein